MRRITSFQDPSISDACIIIDLVDAINNGSIDYSMVKDGSSDEVGVSVLFSVYTMQTTTK